MSFLLVFLGLLKSPRLLSAWDMETNNPKAGEGVIFASFGAKPGA